MISSYKRLVAKQFQNSNVLFDDIIESLNENMTDFSFTSNCRLAYAALIFEGILTQFRGSDNVIALKIDDDVISHIEIFFKRLLYVLLSRMPLEVCETIENFTLDASCYLQTAIYMRDE